jgi:hypothetical protein
LHDTAKTERMPGSLRQHRWHSSRWSREQAAQSNVLEEE